jgi:hypothetical protein
VQAWRASQSARPFRFLQPPPDVAVGQAQIAYIDTITALLNCSNAWTIWETAAVAPRHVLHPSAAATFSWPSPIPDRTPDEHHVLVEAAYRRWEDLYLALPEPERFRVEPPVRDKHDPLYRS